MRKIMSILMIFAILVVNVCAYDFSGFETADELSFRSYNVSYKDTDSIKMFEENGEIVGRWTSKGNRKWTYMSIEFNCPEKNYTIDDWFYFSFYYRINSLNTDENVTTYPKYLSISGYAEEDNIKNFDLGRSDREPYFNVGEWKKTECVIPMNSSKIRKTIRAWLCAGIDSTTTQAYSIDFKNPKCIYVANPHEIKDCSDVEITDVPDTPILYDSGNYHSDYGYKRWVLEGVPEVLSQKVLSGNYAFVKDSDGYWNKNQKAFYENATLFENGELKISGELANNLFNTYFNQNEYITAEEIIRKNKKYDYFYDKRGFLIFSENINDAIDKTSAKRNDAGYKEYKSYYNVSLAMGEITWNDIELTENDWEGLREKYIEALTFKKGTERDFSSYLNSRIDSAISLAEIVNYDNTQKLPFPDFNLDKNIGNTRQIAEAYAISERLGKSNETLKNSALYCLDKIFNNYVYKNAEIGEGWFVNAISYPQMLVQTIAFLYKDIDAVNLNNYLNALYLRAGDTMVTTYCVPYTAQLNSAFGGDIYNPYNNYTNFLWRTLVTYQISVLAKNESRLNHCLRYLNQIFEVIEKGIDDETGWINNGFYNDGSFVFHGNYPNNLGYGMKLILGLADLEYLTRGTKADVKNVYGFNRVYSFLEKNYLPFIYENNNLKIVQGRDTPFGDSAYSTTFLVAVMSLLTGCGESEQINTINQLIKPITEKYDRTYRWNTNVTNINVLRYPVLQSNTVKYIDKLKAMESCEEPEYSNVYYSMDKAVHKKKNFTFMVSMSSERIDKYTAINSEGYADWYIADGMTYLLMDSAQYIQRWWNFVDRYEIPGTTVDSKKRDFYSTTSGVFPNNKWAGGTTDGDISVCGMILPDVAAGKTSHVDGKKSWFMLDDKIICMGSGISGGEGKVYTTVENYISYDKSADGENGYTSSHIDGKTLPYEFDKIYNYHDPKAITVGNRSYVFLEDSSISVKRAKESKRFAGVTTAGNSNAGEFPFVTVKIEHGENPVNQKYCYAILPGADNETAMNYYSSHDFEVVRNDNTAHIIKLKNGTVMANIFESTTVEGIEFKTPSSVIMKPTDFGFELCISDPTQTEKNIEISDNTKSFVIPINKVLGETVNFDVIRNYSAKINTEENCAEIISPEDREVCIIAAAYFDKGLSKLKYKKTQLKNGKNTVNGFDGFSKNDNIRIFIWDNSESITPVK